MAASFTREAFHGPRLARVTAVATSPVRVAYAIRWIELQVGARAARGSAAGSRRSDRPPPVRRVGRRRYPSRHAPVPPVLHHAPRRPLRGGDAVPSPAAAGGLRAPAGRRHLLAAAARLPGQPARRAGDPRGAQRDRRPGDGDAGRPSRRPVAGERPLRRDRPRDGAVQGPRRPGHGARDDPRGGRRRPAPRHRPELPPAAVHRLPLPDEVPRRAPVPRRPDPGPRVRDEGLVQLRPGRGGPRHGVLGAPPRLHPDLRAARPRRRSRSAPTSG